MHRPAQREGHEKLGSSQVLQLVPAGCISGLAAIHLVCVYWECSTYWALGEQGE